MKHLFTITVLSIILAACGTGKSAENDVFTAVVWNVQALFDGEENGNEYSDFRESALWNREKYTARLTAISGAILKMTEEGAALKTAVPDFIGFVEVENAGVLKDLASGVLSKHGYNWTAFATLPGSPLGLGVLSRFPLTEARAHSITVGKDTAPRPVLELRIEPRGRPLVFLLCHWKSKLGGEDATEALRRASARIVQRRLRELNESETETPVIVMGDLNENHDEFFRRGFSCALLPDDPGAAVMAHNASDFSLGFLVLSGEKPPRASCFQEEIPALYSPWYEEPEVGSYLFREKWETIDHILLSKALFDGDGWEFTKCRVLDHPPFTASDRSPNSYVPRYGRGLSDHLPLLLNLGFL